LYPISRQKTKASRETRLGRFVRRWATDAQSAVVIVAVRSVDWLAADPTIARRDARIDVDPAVIAAHRSVDLTAGTQNVEGTRTPGIACLARVGEGLSRSVRQGAGDGVVDVATDGQTIEGPRAPGASRKALVGEDLGRSIGQGAGDGIEFATARARNVSAGKEIAVIQVRGDSMYVDRNDVAFVADIDLVILVC
jgi:hypothetical protein